MPVYRSRRPQVTTQRYRPQVNPACRVSPSHICPSPASSQSRTLTGSAQTSRPRCRQGGVTPFQQKSQLFTSRIGCALGARAASPQMPGCEQAARPTPARLSAAPRNRMQSTPLTLIPFMSRALKPRPACQALLRTARHAPGTAQLQRVGKQARGAANPEVAADAPFSFGTPVMPGSGSVAQAYAPSAAGHAFMRAPAAPQLSSATGRTCKI
jgi:hypothetical protein